MTGSAPRWTTQEDEILRAARSAVNARPLLPGRSVVAIRLRRGVLKLTSCSRWTKIEDNRLLRHRNEPMAKLMERFKSRTREAIQGRRKTLGLQINVSHPWLTTEVKRLRDIFSSATRDELRFALPRHSLGSIEKKGYFEGLTRKPAPARSPFKSLREQIRQRAKEDKIALHKLGVHIGCGQYFCGHPKRDDFEKIAKAVEFFGGRLVIDWQDE